MSEPVGPGRNGDVTRAERANWFQSLVDAPEIIERKSRTVYATMIARSKHLRLGRFTTIGVSDLRLLFDLYDAEFFHGSVGRMVHEDTGGPLDLRLSNRMTGAAGKCTRTRLRATALGTRPRDHYEIAISSLLLFQTFESDGEQAVVAGLACHDRLEALQRVFEHELVHLVEHLAWGGSSCRADRFQALARRLFGHRAFVHDLMTARKKGLLRHGIAVGDRAAFDHEGVRRVGIVNRITRRATVLVESPAGRLFSDGRRYERFYVPLEMLKKVPAAS